MHFKQINCSTLLLTAMLFGTLSCPLVSAVERMEKTEVNYHKLDGQCPLDYSPDGHFLATGSEQSIKIWDTSSEKLIKSLPGRVDVFGVICFSPDSKVLAHGSSHSSIKLWDVSSGKLIRTLAGHSGKINGLSFTNDGKLLATGSADKTIKIWDLASGKLLRTIEDPNMIMSLAFILDGHQLLSHDLDYKVKLWDADSGKLLHTFDGCYRVIAISKDHKTMVGYTMIDPKNGLTGAAVATLNSVQHKSPDAGKLEFIDLSTRKITRSSPKDMNDGFLAMACSPDGKTIASGNSWDYSLGFWDVDSTKELRRCKLGDWVYNLEFSPDGHTVAIGYGNGETETKVVVYPLAQDDILKSRLPKQP